MLFDLKGKRKRTVQVIYVFLALSFVVGFLIFYVGSGTNSGGSVIDALKGNGGGNSLDDQVKKAEEQTRKHPQSEQAWLKLTAAQFSVATSGENYNQQTGQYTQKAAGPAGDATRAWEHYLALKPEKPDPNAAAQVVKLYALALNQPTKAAQTQQIVVEVRPNSASFYQLAQYSYLAGDDRQGDLAAQRAVDLAPKAQRKQVEKQLKDFKKQAAQQAAQSAGGGAGSGG